MSTYAPVPSFVDRKRYPGALIFILAGHAAILAAVMMAKGYVPISVIDPPTIVDLIKDPPAPPENPPPPQPDQRSAIDNPTTIIPTPLPNIPDMDTTLLPLPNNGQVEIPRGDTHLTPTPPVRVGPRFLTREADVKPPYPPSKLRDGEEAVLKLRLSIDERGRVIAVDPVGAADPVFLSAARKHIMARWRYQPATEDGRPIATTTTITLHFELNG